MRILRHPVAVLLLLSALPRILADDSSSLIPEKANETIAVDINQQQQQQQQKESEEELVETITTDQAVPPTAQNLSSPQHEEEDETADQQQQQEDSNSEPIVRPQDTGEGEDSLASSEVYEDPKFDGEEEPIIIPEDDGYSSSLATDDGTVDADGKDTIESTENDNDEMDTEDDLFEDMEESASETVHEDGFRLPALPKIATLEKLSSEIKEDINDDIEVNKAQTDDVSPLPESEPIKTDGGNAKSSKEEKSQSNEESSKDSAEQDDDGDAHNSLEEQGDVQIEVPESTSNESSVPGEELEAEVEQNDDNDNDVGPINTTVTADQTDVEGEEAVISEDSKVTNGTTSVEEVVVEGDDDDAAVSDAAMADDIEVEEAVVLEDAKLAVGTTSVEEVVVEGDDDDAALNGTATADDIEGDETLAAQDVKLDIQGEEEDAGGKVNVDTDSINSDDGVVDEEVTEEDDEQETPQNHTIGDSTGSQGGEEITEVSLKNGTEEMFDDEADKAKSTEPIETREPADEANEPEADEISVKESVVELAGDNSVLDSQDTRVGESKEDNSEGDGLESADDDVGDSEIEQSQNREEQQKEEDENKEEEEVKRRNDGDDEDLTKEVVDDDGLESSDEEKSEIDQKQQQEEDEKKEELEEIKVDDDEDDEDLADRISVDYASKSAGALIIEKTSEFKGTSNLITGDRDRYAIVPCSEEKKHIVLSLSEDILVKEIKLANYERFSSTVKDFQVKGSHTLGKWVDLGTFKAEPGNGEQTFVLENPGWARYLKFKFLTHHGAEWYCTLSQIKVHGSNMVQDFHEHWENLEEGNNEEQLEEDQTESASEIYNTNESGNTDVVTAGKDSSEEADVDEHISNSSVTHEDDPEESTENGKPDGIEKGESVPRHAQVTPSVHSKPKPLDQFRSHLTFEEIILGEIDDEKLFSDLYNLIPHTLENLPAHQKNNLVCKAEDISELRTVHQIGRLAIDSLYSIGSRIVGVSNDADSSTIASPKMNDLSGEYYEKRFGSGLSSMMNLNANNVVDPSSEHKTDSSGNTIVDGSSSTGVDEPSSSAQQTNETHEGTKGELSLMGGKSSASPTKKEESSSQASNLSIDGPDDSLDFALSKLLKDLPSAECLVHLDFTEFKNKVSTTKKSTNASGGSQGGRMMEPIFKKLTDEIFALQTSLSVHDQFSKLSLGCYQRVILDLAMETEKLRRDQDERLRRLEEQMLEPASLIMFQKLVASLVSTIAGWLVSNGTRLFVTMKDDWIPRLLRYYLSKDTYEGFHDAYQTALVYFSHAGNFINMALDHSSRAIETLRQAAETLTKTLESNGWDIRATLQEYLLAWSAYYDGGMAVVAIIITILLCRIIMMCSWSPRGNGKRSSISIRSPRKSPRNGRTTGSLSDVVYSEEAVHALSASSKKQKKKSKKSSKQQHRSTTTTTKDPPTNAPIVEGISAKPSEESIPELQDEIRNESPTEGIPSNGRDGRLATNSPSVVSLDEE